MNSFNPMGGMFTSLNDLSHFFIAHMNNGIYNGVRILNKSTVDEMHTIQHPEIDLFLWNLNYGLGWMFANEFICKTEGHGGIFLGYFSSEDFSSICNEGIFGKIRRLHLLKEANPLSRVDLHPLCALHR